MTDQTNEPVKGSRGPDRVEKGSAMTMIAEENRRRQDKTERLKALRLAQGPIEAAPPAEKPAKAKAAPKAKASPKPKIKRAARAPLPPSQPHSG